MRTVRDGQKVWPYCEECGCRLDIDSEWIEGTTFVIHFTDFVDHKDARGHVCPSLYEYWFIDE